MTAIRHIAVAATGGHFLTAEFERRVSLWSRDARTLVAQMDTVLDFGGRRLALCGTDSPIVVAGAWVRHGICGYAQDGSLLWQRKDLKKVQHLAPVTDGALVAACFDEGHMQLLAAETGASVGSVRGVRGFVDGPDTGFGIGENLDEVSAIDSRDWQVRWRAHVGGLAVLASAVAPGGIAVATGGGHSGSHDASTAWVVALDPDGSERWRWACSADQNCLALAWDHDASAWVGVLNDMATGRASTLARWSPDGALLAQRCLGSFAAHEFLAGGRYLVTSDGAVRDSTTGDVEWQFHEAQA